ncbi:Cupin domain-containing protein [Bordetella sputigena]|uniref:cupin domain-containing protein n=1 Tax=Bordetella sputigena TaxID=1416810 RepID=UPI0039EE3ECB
MEVRITGSTTEARGEPGDAPASGAQGVGEILRRLRIEKGWTLKRLAQDSGVSVGMISQIERDMANPSVRVLTAIRRSLGAPLEAVFRDVAPPHVDDPAEPDFVRRANERPILELGTLRKELLTSSGHHNLQMMVLHIDPGGHSGKTALSYPAEKGGMVLSGELLLTVAGKTARLREGDSFVFDSALEHSFSNPTDRMARVMWIISAVQLDRHL